MRLRDASASARVSSTGRVSHVSQPMQLLTPQPVAAAAARAGEGAEVLAVGVNEVEGAGPAVAATFSVLG